LVITITSGAMQHEPSVSARMCCSHVRDDSIHQLFIDRPSYRQEPVASTPHEKSSEVMAIRRGRL